jgi:hypothetical protein
MTTSYAHLQYSQRLAELFVGVIISCVNITGTHLKNVF